MRYKEGGAWVDRSFQQVLEIVKPLSLGLVALGVEKGDRVSILGNTRPEWTYFDYAALSAGATVVPIYQTNSPEECAYVLENSDAKVVVVEDEEQLAKVREVRASLPRLEHIVTMVGEADDVISMEALAQKGATVDEADLPAADRRRHQRRTSAPSSTPRARPGRRRAA